MPVRNNVRVIVFAVVLAVVCSLLLAGTNVFTGPYRRANEEAEELRNYLSALEVPVDVDADSKTLLDIFNREVQIKEIGGLTLYEYRPSDLKPEKPIAIAVPFSGAGLWGPIKGVLALAPDLRTIRGIRFYQQEETPGLGGEIGASWFQEQFEGKEIVSSDGVAGFNILRPGGSPGRNEVDGISGATMTSERIELILDRLAVQVGEVRRDYVD